MNIDTKTYSCNTKLFTLCSSSVFLLDWLGLRCLLIYLTGRIGVNIILVLKAAWFNDSDLLKIGQAQKKVFFGSWIFLLFLLCVLLISNATCKFYLTTEDRKFLENKYFILFCHLWETVMDSTEFWKVPVSVGDIDIFVLIATACFGIPLLLFSCPCWTFHQLSAEWVKGLK